jgi:hypothetical protein
VISQYRQLQRAADMSGAFNGMQTMLTGDARRAMSSTGGQMTPQPANSYTLHVHTANRTTNIVQDFDMLRSLANRRTI